MYTIEKNIFAHDGDNTVLNSHVFDPQGKGLARVETFKGSVMKIMQAIKFSAWNKEE